MRSITEQHTFTQEQLLALAKSMAKIEIIGSFYRGEFHQQEAHANEDGSITVITTHSPDVR